MRSAAASDKQKAFLYHSGETLKSVKWCNNHSVPVNSITLADEAFDNFVYKSPVEKAG